MVVVCAAVGAVSSCISISVSGYREASKKCISVVIMGDSASVLALEVADNTPVWSSLMVSAGVNEVLLRRKEELGWPMWGDVG